MKKIYSFMLLAAAMLLSINANADLIEVSDGAGLKTALEETRANGDIIRLVGTDAIAINNAITFNQAVSVTLDLNGLDVTTGVKAPFLIKKGELIVTGMGTMTNTSTADGANMFTVYGTYKPQVNGVYEDTNKDYYTHLLVDEGVSIYVNNSIKGKGVMVQYTLDQIFCGVSEGHAYVTGWGLANGVVVDIKGDIQVHSTKGYCVQVSGAVRFAGECVNPDVYGTVYTRGGKGTAAKPYTYTVKPNWGATTTTDGKRGYKFYVKENDVDVAYIADSSWGEFAPKINLHSTCHLSANNASTGAAAIYAAGYAFWDIRCEAEGSCALAAKSGQITVTDAVLESTATEYQQAEPVTNAQGKVIASGIDTQGSAVVIESNQSYSGGIQITFAGDTRIESQAGYAVEEAVTTEYTGTKVSAITIEGGAFVGGNEGCIVISQPTLDAATGETPTVPITINGGMYEDENDPNKAATNTLISQIINGGNTYTTEIATSNPGTGVAIVITSGNTPDPVDDPTNFNIDKLYELNSASTDPEDWNDIDLSNLPDGTVFTLVKDDDHGDLTLGDIMMNGMNEGAVPTPKSLTIVVEDGVTFKTKKIIMNKTARIIVKAGGKLIVAGEQGIIATAYENITVEAREGKSGTFLIHPISSSNRHPKATVEFISKAFRVSSTNLLWQRFGVPSYKELNSITWDNTDSEFSTYVSVFDNSIGEEGDWRNLGKLGVFDLKEMSTPFVCCNMLCNAQTGGTKYTMTADLVGNGDALIDASVVWASGANSYLADIDLTTFYNTLGENMAKTIYIYQQQGNANYYTWEPYDNLAAYLKPNAKLPAMQAFILRRTNDDETPVVLDYQAAVYNPAMGIVPNNDAPARRGNNNDWTLAQIRMSGNNASDNIIIAQSDDFSASYDNGFDAEKYMGGDLNLFVTDEAKMAHFATDDLNNTYVGYTAKAGVYTLSFENVRGSELTLVDLSNGVRTAMAEGATYTFQVAENETNDYRFQIVEAAKMPTDVEAIEAVAKKAGIYTLTGQYLGNASKWNTLPAGIYVVDGVKKVR